MIDSYLYGMVSTCSRKPSCRGRAEGAAAEGIFHLPDRGTAGPPDRGAYVCLEVCYCQEQATRQGDNTTELRRVKVF